MTKVDSLTFPDGKIQEYAYLGRDPMSFAINDYMSLAANIGTGSTTNNPGATTTTTNQRAIYVPFRISTRRKITALALAIGAANAGASAVVRLGIHNDNGSGRPGTVLKDAGTASVNVGSSLKELTFTELILESGLYQAVAVFQGLDTAGTNPSWVTPSNSAQAAPETAPTSGNNSVPYSFTTGVSGALAANPTITLGRTNGPPIPAIWAKVSG